MKLVKFVLLLIPLLHYAAGPVLAQTIVLLPQATVNTPQFTLGQIARIESSTDGDADRVGKLAIQPAPAVGGTVTLTLAALRERLSELGVNRAIWTLHGAAACRVTRVASPDDQIVKLQERSTTLRAGLSGPVVSVPEPAIPDSLAGCILKLLTDQYQPAGGKLALTFDQADHSLLALQRPQYRFELGIKRAGDAFVDVAIQVYNTEPASAADLPTTQPASAGQLVKTASVRVRAELAAPVVVTIKPINRGQVIAADDVQLSCRPISLTSSACRELAGAVGQQARRVIKPDEVLQPADLTPLALVHRNKLVTVWSRRGGMLLKTIGRAMADGVYGERILVRNEVSHEPFFGIVTGPDTVELDTTPVQETRTPGSKPAGKATPKPGQQPAGNNVNSTDETAVNNPAGN